MSVSDHNQVAIMNDFTVMLNTENHGVLYFSLTEIDADKTQLEFDDLNVLNGVRYD